jgi:hypothetical protein
MAIEPSTTARRVGARSARTEALIPSAIVQPLRRSDHPIAGGTGAGEPAIGALPRCEGRFCDLTFAPRRTGHSGLGCSNARRGICAIAWRSLESAD